MSDSDLSRMFLQSDPRFHRRSLLDHENLRENRKLFSDIETIFIHLLTIILTPIWEIILIAVICLLNAVFFHRTDENHFVAPVVEVKRSTMGVIGESICWRFPLCQKTSLNDRRWIMPSLCIEIWRWPIGKCVNEFVNVFSNCRWSVPFETWSATFSFYWSSSWSSEKRTFSSHEGVPMYLSSQSQTRRNSLGDASVRCSTAIAWEYFSEHRSSARHDGSFICSLDSEEEFRFLRLGFETSWKNDFSSTINIIRARRTRVTTFESVSFSSRQILVTLILAADSPFYLSKSLRVRQIRLERKLCHERIRRAFSSSTIPTCFAGEKNLMGSSSHVVAEQRTCSDVCNYTSVYSALASRPRRKLYVTHESPWYFQMHLSPEETVRRSKRVSKRDETNRFELDRAVQSTAKVLRSEQTYERISLRETFDRTSSTRLDRWFDEKTFAILIEGNLYSPEAATMISFVLTIEKNRYGTIDHRVFIEVSDYALTIVVTHYLFALLLLIIVSRQLKIDRWSNLLLQFVTKMFDIGKFVRNFGFVGFFFSFELCRIWSTGFFSFSAATTFSSSTSIIAFFNFTIFVNRWICSISSSPFAS